ncbi:S9 family peptidase [Bacteroidota bacterium]
MSFLLFKRILVLFLISSIYSYGYKSITLEDIFLYGTFAPEVVYGIESMNDGRHYTQLKDYERIEKYAYQTDGVIDVLFSLGEIENDEFKYIEEYYFNKDENQLLLLTESEKVYRHSYKSHVFLYDFKKKKLSKINKNGKIQLATFSPDGRHIAYVQDNNLYLYEIDKGIKFQITDDGKWNEIINGAPDWVYEEEFGFSKGFQWSVKGDKIAYYRFDERHVKEFNMLYYEDIYPMEYRFKYPKAGEQNSIVQIFVYDLNTKKIALVDLGDDTDQYIPRIKWTNNNDLLCVARMNRLQNCLDLLLFDSRKGETRTFYTENDDRFISELDNNFIHFIGKEECIIQSEKNGYKHIFLYSLNGDSLHQITKGNWDIADINGVNEKTGRIYYESYEVSPLETHVYSIHKNGNEKMKLSGNSGTNEALFSDDFSYFINYHTTANRPYFISIHDEKGKEVRVLKDNKALNDTLKEYGFSSKEFIKIPGSGDFKLNAYLIHPPDFDSTKKHPVFLYVYSGPGTQKVRDQWDSYLPYFNFLAQQGYVVACVDTRGTGARGAEFKKSVYMNLGKYELEDLLRTAEYFSSLTYIDASRMGIFGWSYGGFLTALCLTKGKDLFKIGVAVAPVTDWRFYDSIYTERYMRAPKDNREGYYNYSPVHYVDSLKGDILIIHGSADDNVHLQNSMVFINALVNANKQFEMQIYPNKNHNINGGYTSYHLFKRITGFLEEKL